MKVKKGLLILCAVLLVAASVAGTVAYFTDSESVVNTFSVGKVVLGDENEKGLDEAKVNEYGEAVEGAARVQANTYKLVPGRKYTKDPTVHVKNDSEDCYIFVKVENGIKAIEAPAADGYKQIATQITDNGWNELDGVAGVYWRKWEKPEDTTGTTDLEVFAEFKIGGDAVDAAKLKAHKDARITVTAYAIQAAGFDTAADAWTAGNWA